MDEAAVAAHPAPVASVASATPVPIRSLVEGWLAYSSRQLKPRVRITYGANVERFLTFLGDVAFQNVSETDLWRFIDAEMAICGNLRTLNIERIRGFRCEAGVFGRTPKPPATCGPGCPTYVGRNPSVVGHALKGINSFLRYAMRRGHLARNPAQDVAREFARDYPIAKFLRRRRQPTVQDVKTLIMGTLHPARKAVYMTLAKTGFRVHELVALTVDETCLDVEAKTIRIPLPGEDQPGKRRGKRLGFIDEELGEVLREYLDYRRGLLARRPPERQPKQLFLGDNGRPVTPAHINRHWLREDTVRLGLVRNWKDKTQRMSCHTFRHFFSSTLMQKRCPETFVFHLRGDLVKNMVGVYFDPSESELRAIYFEFFPRILV